MCFVSRIQFNTLQGEPRLRQHHSQGEKSRDPALETRTTVKYETKHRCRHIDCRLEAIKQSDLLDAARLEAPRAGIALD
jgi:hypothetical protein